MSTDIQQRIADAAIQRDRERSETRRRVEEILRLDTREHLGHLVDFGDNTFVAEIRYGDGSVTSYGVVMDGKRISRFGETLHEAILIAIAIRNGVNVNDLYPLVGAAGRVLSARDGDAS
jgi:ketosteroid isomerase-like protein